ncbi:hypothetical protein MLD38_006483 [Melastoma candidum]|uniref:Uncharacterized protein n=1 Tax=Melastoma candidum TaxID=119954 RepID=A0ACB9RN50_9MYRT|nr:hypothetical protein MLD38_006483 [Melastoma candidum]
MSKMKHLLRKLHIGGVHDHHQHPRPHTVADPSPSLDATRSPSPSPPPPPVVGAESESGISDACDDFCFLEEEFQVQLALAISASSADQVCRSVPTEDPDESAQIDAAKQISLAATGSGGPGGIAELQSLQYWSYNVINYDEKVMDGFYEVYPVKPSTTAQGRMPLLADLRASSETHSIDFEVVYVNRLIDLELQQLENSVIDLAVGCHTPEGGLLLSSVVQGVADLVVHRMGGIVGDVDGMGKRWLARSHELRSSLQSVVLPLGLLDVGLSRHRACLFKVLADKINLPCKLVKGSYYTGTDDGAVNLIKIDDGNGRCSEYIIDLMGAPGSLIPVEVSSTVQSECSCDMLDRRTLEQVHEPSIDDSAINGGLSEENQINMLENVFGKVRPSIPKSVGGLSSTRANANVSRATKVDNISEYVVSASKDPELAYKLRAGLLESGASPSCDLFSEIDAHDRGDKKVIQNDTKLVGGNEMDMEKKWNSSFYHDVSTSGTEGNFFVTDGCKVTFPGHATSLEESVPAKPHDATTSGRDRHFKGRSVRNSHIEGQGGIKWDDLQIGERIGIGSYGEVYRADWNGTEVAVKKFLDQDFSGDALCQFKIEVEIMLRLRHPNIVLFMAAVTQSPHFSILTEFIPRGSLYKLLHRSNVRLNLKRRMLMALDVATGMNYLHTSHPTIVHRDLKSPNLLIDNNWTVKVCDFGLSRIKHNTFLSSKSTAGTPEWMAPEVLRNEPANEKCDVYSFGVILWELVTMSIPWNGLNPMQVVGAVGFQNRHLEIPADAYPPVADIIQECWQTDPRFVGFPLLCHYTCYSRKRQLLAQSKRGLSTVSKEELAA